MLSGFQAYQYSPVALQPFRGNISTLFSFQKSTAGLLLVLAVAKLAVAEKRTQFHETFGYLLWFQMPEAEFANAR